LVVALNPAIDVTYDIDRLRPGATNRVEAVRSRAGGKPINVARILAALGVEVTLVGLATADVLERLDQDRAISATWIDVPGEARRTVTIVERHGGQVTSFNEPGPSLTDDVWPRLQDAVAQHLPAAAVVLSGSLPPGLPDDAYARLIDLVRAKTVGSFVALDTSGRGHVPALVAGPDLTKPNTDELAELGWGDGTVLAGAGDVQARGSAVVAVSCGPAGLVALTDSGTWLLAQAPVVDGGNPVGAGDAVVASLVSTHGSGLDWPERLRRAAALGAAVVYEPVAGAFDPARYQALLRDTRVEAHR
jgi:tagatose 6-phosphate kinase